MLTATRAPLRSLAARALSAAANPVLVPEATTFSATVNDRGIAMVRLDTPDSKVNTISSTMGRELGLLVDAMDADASVKGAVLISAKKGNFIAGADISELASIETEADAMELLEGMHVLLNRVEQGSKPFVAAIDGSAMGGGLETALACHHRICTQNSVLSLPEVMLGLLPGGGGTQRLPRLVGLQKALPLLLTGKNTRAAQAKRMGLVDAVADPHALEAAAVEACVGLADGSVKRTVSKKKHWTARLLEDTPLRGIIFKKAKEMVDKQTGGNYPAPYEILKAVEAGVSQGFERGSQAEKEGFARLVVSPESDALVSIFFGQTACKKSPWGKPERRAETVAVLGAGLMGAGIAQVSAAKKMRVLLKDQSVDGVSRGVDYIEGNFDKKLKKRQMTVYDRATALSRVVPLHDGSPSWQRHFASADVVIEAVFEDLALKHKVIQEMEAVMPEHCVFASNTSALPITELAKASARPENIVGLHYFSPVPQMPLVEIIPHAGTSDEALARVHDVATRQGKTPIVVKDVPGFYVNRCLGPFMSESMALLGEGVAPAALDKALTAFGMPVGPVALADEVGIDVAGHVAHFLADKLEKRMDGGKPEILDAMLEGGYLGRKSGSGFYMYGGGKSKGGKQVNPEAAAILKRFEQRPEQEASAEQMAERMIGRFVIEAAMCLQDEIIADPRTGDIGAVFGTGFSPFRGGPFRYVDAMGAQAFVDQMNGYRDQLGDQFEPPQILKDYAAAGKKFHSS